MKILDTPITKSDLLSSHVVFDGTMINIRPRQGNRSRTVEDPSDSR